MLESEFRELKLEVSASAVQQLSRYANEIEHWNKAVNLTSLRGAALVRRLIAEPAWVGHQLQMEGRLADVGSGNGSPGIPLQITRRISATFLIEPRMKRAAFLRHVIGKLGLKGVEVNRNRVEDIPERSMVADWIVLQAIDPSPLLIEALRRIATHTTRVVWITSIQSSPVKRAEMIQIPESTTKVWIFGLDQI
jgi:16S rRNA (guanine527-N7)-methyltransferase